MENICNICGYKNPEDNFICEQDDCGVPMDILIELNSDGLPELKY